MATGRRTAAIEKDPDDYDLVQLAGRMTAKALGCDDDEAPSLATHEIGQFLHRWLRRQDRPVQTGLIAAYGITEDPWR
jgi:hypothetical protein